MMIKKEDVFLKTNPITGLWYQIDDKDSIILSLDHGTKYYKVFDRSANRYNGESHEDYKLTKTQIVYYNNGKEDTLSLK